MTILQQRRSDPILEERGPIACLMLHGFAGSPAEIRPLADYLAANEITVRAPLLPGHGTSPEDLRGMHWPEWVRAAEEELQALTERYQQVHLIGFSMGGLISLHLAAHRDVTSVITLSSPSQLADWRHFFVPLARYIIKDYPTRISNPSVAAQLESYDRIPVDAIHSLIRLNKQVRKELPRVRAPILAIQGDRDKWIAPDSANYILSKVSSQVRERILLPGRNHMLVLEHGREEVFSAALNWLRRFSAG